MIGAKTVGPGFADSFSKIGLLVNQCFERSYGGIGLKGLLQTSAEVDHVSIIVGNEALVVCIAVLSCMGDYLTFSCV